MLREIGWIKKVPPCPHNIIDLEESIDRVSNEDEQHAPSSNNATLTIHSKCEHEIGFSILSDPVISCTVKKDLPDKISHICPFLDDHKCCQEKNYLKKCTFDLSADIKSYSEHVVCN